MKKLLLIGTVIVSTQVYCEEVIDFEKNEAIFYDALEVAGEEKTPEKVEPKKHEISLAVNILAHTVYIGVPIVQGLFLYSLNLLSNEDYAYLMFTDSPLFKQENPIEKAAGVLASNLWNSVKQTIKI